MENVDNIDNINIPQKVILFNGPPNSGKDASASIMKKLFGTGEHRAFKDILYEETAKYFDIDLEKFTKAATDRSTKEKPTRNLFDKGTNFFIRFLLMLFSLIRPVGFSPRQALIHVSENIIKPAFGKTYFGFKLMEAIKNSGAAFTYISDSGFVDELRPLVEAGFKIYLVRLHRDGCTYVGDSRQYLTDEQLRELGITVYDVDNNGDLIDLENNLMKVALSTLGVSETKVVQKEQE